MLRNGEYMKREDIMKYIPKTKRTAIYDAWEDDDGYWILLNDGWNADRMDWLSATIHENDLKELRYQIGGIHKISVL